MSLVLDAVEFALWSKQLHIEFEAPFEALIEPEWEPPPLENRRKYIPAQSPSEIWGRKPETFIGIRLKDQTGEPIIGSRIRIKLPDGSSKEGTTDDNGELEITGFTRDGNANIEFLDHTKPGKSEAPEWPEEKEFKATVVDEIGNPVSDLWLWFRHGNAYNLVRTDGSGVATYKTSDADSVSVSFESADALAQVMKPIWSEARGTKRDDWLKPEAGKVAVVALKGGSLQQQVPVADNDDDNGNDDSHNDTKLAEQYQNFDGVKLPLGQSLQLSVQPHTTLVRLVGVSFDTDKSFLLSTALPAMRRIKDLYAEHTGDPLLIVGHADASGGVAYNETLSLERAGSVLAYLSDDVDSWLGQYEDTVSQSKRWGKGEDKLMLRGLVARKQGFTEPETKAYQTWHNALPADKRAANWAQLDEDGDMGTATRTQLIGDYMNLDGTTLPSNMRIALHGCGEAFPLPEPSPESAWERFSTMRNRRVEFLFFNQLTGVVPEPASDTSAPGSLEYPGWLAQAEVEDLTTEEALREVTFVEMHDALFRTNSAVILPEGEDPTTSTDGHRALTTVGLFATVLRYNDIYPGKKLFIAGHTDTQGSDQFNQPLSEERAKSAIALLVGQRDNFITLCDKRHDEVDVTQIFDWTTRAFGFTCKPTTLTAPPSDERYKQFRTSFNNWVNARDVTVEPDARSTDPKLAEQGRLDKTIWGAIFDLYEHNLRRELEEDRAGAKALRDQLVWVDDNRKTLGFAERFPVDDLAKDDFRSQSNRRVEILMFDPGEEPDVAAMAADPDAAAIYMPGEYIKRPVAMSSAGPAYAWVESDSLVDIPDTPFSASSVPVQPIEEVDDEGFYLTCPSISDRGVLDDRHAASHGNVSPCVSWSGQDDKVQEFVLVLVDRDEQDLLHWVVRDIPATESQLPEAAKLTATSSATTGATATVQYRGPAPLPAETHRYLFRLYALGSSIKGVALPQNFAQIDAMLMSQNAKMAEVYASYSE